MVNKIALRPEIRFGIQIFRGTGRLKAFKLVQIKAALISFDRPQVLRFLEILKCVIYIWCSS